MASGSTPLKGITGEIVYCPVAFAEGGQQGVATGRGVNIVPSLATADQAGV